MLFFFFFNDTATTEIYTLSLHDALPISSVFQRGDNVCRYAITSRRSRVLSAAKGGIRVPYRPFWITRSRSAVVGRSEEHTSELQSLAYLVCRLLLEKKKKR